MYISCNPLNYQTIVPILEHFSPYLENAVDWWNTLVQNSVKFSLFHQSLQLYVKLKRVGCTPDSYTFPFVIKACGGVLPLRLGEAVHGQGVVHGFGVNLFVNNSLVSMYGKCGAVDHARQVFDEMCERGVFDVVSWNSIVAAYVQNGCFREGLELFEKMSGEFGERPGGFSLVNVLPCCGSLGSVRLGRQVHGFAVRNGLFDDVYVGNALVDMYAKCGMIEDASTVFKSIGMKDVVSWNGMVTAYAQSGRFDEALSLFEDMKNETVEANIVTWTAVIAAYAQRERGYEALDLFREMISSGLEPNVVTLTSLLSGCACVGALLHGKEAHCYALKRLQIQGYSELGHDITIVNGLIDMYAKCKSFEIARKIFDSVRIEDRNVVTWTALIGGHAQHGDANEAIKLFSRMLQQTHTLPNAFTISCVLMACAQLGALRIGEQVHAYTLRNQLEPALLFVANCLIDMYSKSGNIDAAQIIFNSMRERNAVSWTSLMAGYGMHGRGKEAIQIFDQMRRDGLPPDGLTSLVLLYACSHSGLVEEGIEYFNNMAKEFGVVPGAEHYACVVDLLGRAGRFDQAKRIIDDMPMNPHPIIWISLLGSCRIHRNIELGEYAASRLSKLKSQDDGTYTLLSNIYAGARRWKDVSNIRSIMKQSGVKKKPGCSWVQGKQGTETFYVGDWSHPLSQQMYELLSNLMQRIKAIGYVPETSFVLHDVEDEEKGDLLLDHSEKLALAYAILTSRAGSTIRITKNLRVCGDCHTVFKYISQVVDHEIILRDSSRFHHFNNGCCSCKGFW
ncbi:hypothetical protein vseg_009176 [Gypsophila vaccaria]